MRSDLIKYAVRAATFTALATLPTVAMAAPVYLNAASGITVSLGSSHDADVLADPTNGPFVDISVARALVNVIDAPTASSNEIHSSGSSGSHVWVSGKPLELVFDFGAEYDLSAMYFWNYYTETYDVDTIVFTFYDDAWGLVGSLTESPRLGNMTGGGPITPEEYLLDFPTNVRYVNALLSGSNGHVDFNNIGFTAVLSDPNPDPTGVPEPAGMALLGFGFAGLGMVRRRR